MVNNLTNNYYKPTFNLSSEEDRPGSYIDLGLLSINPSPPLSIISFNHCCATFAVKHFILKAAIYDIQSIISLQIDNQKRERYNYRVAILHVIKHLSVSTLKRETVKPWSRVIKGHHSIKIGCYTMCCALNTFGNNLVYGKSSAEDWFRILCDSKNIPRPFLNKNKRYY